MRRFSTTTVAAVAALALLCTAPAVWACGGTSGGGGGTSGGGTSGGSGGGGGGGGTSTPPCYQMAVVPTPNPALAPDTYYATNLKFVTTITNCGTVDDSPVIYYHFTPTTYCPLTAPTIKVQVFVPAGTTVTITEPWPGAQNGCPTTYNMSATATLKGGAVLVASATASFTFVNAMPGP